MKTVLSIAGTDPTGGAGIQADLKTVEAHNLYGMSVITAVVAQNTLGVTAVQPVSPTLVGQQIDCVFDDIRPDAIKIGMLHNSEIIRTVAARLRAHHADNIVLDPVMISSSGHDLLRPDAVKALVEEIFPLCTLVTPNLAEAAALSGVHIANKAQMEQAAQEIAAMTQGAVLVKGGHLSDCADDLLYADGQFHWLPAPRIHNPNTHGTGCTLSSAIACGLAQGISLTGSVKRAKRYLTACIQFGLDLGHGSGPLQHKVDWE
ncbi:MAG TPA: bifunctional hydroxymethylpyrimidine kinase/phosphomethylpyrimidine kinase [Candidatus Agathobaculum intestinipullorum]|nr:bifunctional hydroxymethylpyrimidine kinase/phosphomethylpyrimidine kinase [Candidatus Agathobaculum intestinipullorum]